MWNGGCQGLREEGNGELLVNGNNVLAGQVVEICCTTQSTTLTCTSESLLEEQVSRYVQ